MTDPANLKQIWSMGPTAAADYLREHCSTEDQLAALQEMLAAGGHITNLAHGIAIALNIDEHWELKTALVHSLKMTQSDMSVGYGGQVGKDASERSAFAGKGPMFAKMSAADADVSEAETLVKVPAQTSDVDPD